MSEWAHDSLAAIGILLGLSVIIWIIRESLVWSLKQVVKEAMDEREKEREGKGERE